MNKYVAGIAIVSLVMMTLRNLSASFIDMVFWGFILCATLLWDLRNK